MSDIDWPVTRSILYWIYWLIPEVYYQLLSDIDWPATMSIYSFLWISSQRTFYGKRNMFTHIFLSPKCINTCVTISSKQISNILTHTFISPEHKHGWHFFQMKIFLNMFTHTINLHNTLPHWSQRKTFKCVHCSPNLFISLTPSFL